MSAVTPPAKVRHRESKFTDGSSAAAWLERKGPAVFLHRTYVGGGGESQWQACAQEGCVGQAIVDGGLCFAHADAATRRAYAARAISHGEVFSLRGNEISVDVWNAVLNDGNMVRDGVPTAGLSMAGALIDATMRFRKLNLSTWIDFSAATIRAPVEFAQCALANVTLQSIHCVNGPLSFADCKFESDVDLSGAKLERVSLGLEDCELSKSLLANDFEGAIAMSRAEIAGRASFQRLKGALVCTEAIFGGDINLTGADLFGGLHGERMIAKSASGIGPLHAGGVWLGWATMHSRVQIDASVRELHLSNASMQKGGTLRLREGTVRLDGLMLGGPLRVTGSVEHGKKPEVLSVRSADAGQISFAHVDMRRCVFHGANGLDQVDLEATALLPRGPRRSRFRRFIADELAWRTHTGRSVRGWEIEGVVVGHELPPRKKGQPDPVLLPPLSALEVASTYRQLRRSLESRSDMPGAADFYYGEMQMRRAGESTSGLQSALLWCYWAISGYGLRPLRAVGIWLVLLGLGVYAFDSCGFVSKEPRARAILVAVRASFGIGAPETLLTASCGIPTETALRVFGPLTLAALALALRATLMRKPSE